jgi:hypothetical protein
VSRVLAVTTAVIGLAVAGCGGDDSGETTAPTVSIPAVTSPIPGTATTPATTPPASTPTGSTAPNGGGNDYNPKQPDSATNDVPPAAGSPQETFEKQCRQNPQACG